MAGIQNLTPHAAVQNHEAASRHVPATADLAGDSPDHGGGRIRDADLRVGFVALLSRRPAGFRRG